MLIWQDIFEFFIRQLRSIADKDSPHFTKSFYLLESLSQVKSIVLLTDLGADDLLTEIFRDFFEIIRFVSSYLETGLT